LEELPLEISTDRARLNVDLIYAFLAESYWAAGRSRAAVEKSISHSLCFGAYIRGEQVAFARVVTDQATFGYLADVFVVPEWRGRGISKQLIQEILDHPDLADISLLLRTRDAHELYRRFGFRACEDPERFMTLVNKRGSARDP
jgi:GNAT superfamily N-acetyltransferase